MSGADSTEGGARVSGVKGVKKVVLVLRGKGGVGKSTVSCQVLTLCALHPQCDDPSLDSRSEQGP